MKQSGYQLLICEPDTGIVLNDSGGRILDGNSENYLPVCETPSEAISTRKELLDRIPWCVVSIRDLNTGEIDAPLVSPLYPEFTKQRREWTKWQTSFPLIRPFIKKPHTPLIERQAKAQPSVPPNPPPSGPVD